MSTPAEQVLKILKAQVLELQLKIERLEEHIYKLETENERIYSNYDYIKHLSVEELADYIYSVFLAGRLTGQLNSQECDNIMVDYRSWLLEPVNKEKI